MSPWSDTFLAPHTSQVGIGSQPLSLHHRHGSESEVWVPGKPVVFVEKSLLKVVLLGQFHFPVVAEAEPSVWQEQRPALDIPVFLGLWVCGFLALPRSKVEVCCLVAFVVQKDLGVTVDQCAVLVVVKMLSPHWIIFNIFLFFFHGYLHLIFSFVVRVSDCLVFHLHLARDLWLSKIFFNVVLVIFQESQPPLVFYPAPGLVGFFVVVELVIGILCLCQVPQGKEDLLRSDPLAFLVRLVLLLSLQLDGDDASLSGQSGQLFCGVHDIRWSNRNADHPPFACCHSGPGKEHNLLEIDVHGYEGIF